MLRKFMSWCGAAIMALVLLTPVILELTFYLEQTFEQLDINLRTPELWGVSLGIYGIILIFKTLVQYYGAVKNYNSVEKGTHYRTLENPRVIVSVVGFKEDLKDWTACLDSVWVQSIPVQRIYICVDGCELEENKDMIRVVHEKFPGQVFSLHLGEHYQKMDQEEKKNTLLEYHVTLKEISQPIILVYKPWGGKRDAMFANLILSQAEDPTYIYLTDSDTILNENNIEKLTHTLARYPHSGGAGGQVCINPRQLTSISWYKKILVNIQTTRYLHSRFIETAAQSRYGCLSTIPGPNGLYRASAVYPILDEWFGQTQCCGQPSTYGDDTHLTKQIEKQGFYTLFNHQANTLTQCPDSICVWISQQKRWTKSGVREFMFMARHFLWQRSWYIQLDAWTHFFFAWAVTLSLLILLIWGHLYEWLIFFTVVNVISTLRAFMLWRFLDHVWYLKLKICGGFALYGLIFITILIPVRILAFFTMRDLAWGTQHVSKKKITCLNQNTRDFFWVALWWLALCIKTIWLFVLEYDFMNNILGGILLGFIMITCTLNAF